MGELEIRALEASDFDLGYLSVLSQLTTVGQVTPTSFQQRLDEIRKNPDYYLVVAVENKCKVVGAASLLVEHKFIHECGSIGHIEDVVVDKGHRGSGLGQRLLETLKAEAQKRKCYKIILDCDERNVKFYERCGLQTKGIQMALYF